MDEIKIICPIMSRFMKKEKFGQLPLNICAEEQRSMGIKWAKVKIIGIKTKYGAHFELKMDW